MTLAALLGLQGRFISRNTKILQLKNTTTTTRTTSKATMATTATTTIAAVRPADQKYLNNSKLIYEKTVDAQSSFRDEQIADIVKTLCPNLFDSKQQSDNDRIVVRPLTGGLSNELFVATRNSSTVLVRIYPTGQSNNDNEDENNSSSNNKNSTEVVDRDTENDLAAWLSEHGVAPIYYGRFQNGRVEEYYPNVAPLSSQQMPLYARQTAKAMAAFHNLNTPEDVLPKPSSSSSSKIHEVIQDWFRIAYLSENLTKKNLDFLKELQKEWDWLYLNLQTTATTTATGTINTNSETATTTTRDVESVQALASNFIRQVVVTHMDVQSLNILKSDQDDTIKIIDFEYAGWNPRAADIANTFCEYCDMNNINANYEEEYPTRSQQNEYLTQYVQVADPKLAKELDDGEASAAWVPFLDQLRLEIGRFSLLSHLGWAVWSVVKANEESSSSIDFDYIHYARHRMEGYNFAKQKFFFKLNM